MTRRRTWTIAATVVAAVLALAPGWAARPVPVDHDAILAAASRARSQLGVSAAGDAPGEQWHLQYLDSWSARMLAELGLRRAVPSLVPPDFVAHIPPGAQRADGYFAVESSWRWPWWRPGGGVDWSARGDR